MLRQAAAATNLSATDFASAVGAGIPLDDLFAYKGRPRPAEPPKAPAPAPKEAPQPAEGAPKPPEPPKSDK